MVMRQSIHASLLMATLLVAGLLAQVNPAYADVIAWKGPTHTITLGLSEQDVTHVEFPEPIVNITVENPDYVDMLVVSGYNNKAFRMRSMLPKMATRIFFTGASQQTYVVVVTTDVPYRAFIQIVDSSKVDQVAQAMSKKFGPNDLIRAMALDKELPGVMRETHVIPNWFNGGGLKFELSEVWQTPLLTGLLVHVSNQQSQPNEVNLPAITVPKTDEWGVLRKAAMENMRLAPKGRPNDQGLLFLVFSR